MKRKVTRLIKRVVGSAAFFLLLTATTMSVAQTNISGTISSNTTWNLTGSPYVITGDLTIGSGNTLTIEPEVEIRLQENRTIYVNGTMNADSASFTSDLASPAMGDWRRIRVSGSATITNSSFQYGGRGNVGAIEVYGGSLTLATSTISNSVYGVQMSTANTVSFDNVTITSTEWPIYISGSPQLSITGANTLTGNSHDGIYLYSNQLSDSFTLPTASIPYVFRSDYTINSSGELIVGTENILKFQSSRELNVQGKLKVVADTMQSIYFTSYNNDNLGGDTNDDGSSSAPSSRYWDGIRFMSGSIDTANILKRVNITYTGANRHGAVSFYSASPTVTQSDIQNNYIGLYMSGTSNPTVRQTSVGTSDLVPIAMSLNADPVFIDNDLSFADNSFDAIGILEENVTLDSRLKVRNFTGIDNITYLSLGNVTINSGVTLTVDERVVWKFDTNDRLVVEGTLTADATDSTQIVFTSVKDDNHGNPKDTNRDGNQSTPDYNDWYGIEFTPSSTGSLMDYTIVQFANNRDTYHGYPYYFRYYSAIVIDGSSPTITNSNIKDVEKGIFVYRDASPVIQNNTLSNSRSVPVALSMSATPTFGGNVMVNASLNALGIIAEELGLDGTVARRDFAGYQNITYVQLGDIVITSGAQVNVEPGTVIKMDRSTDIFVDGGFKLEGNSTDGSIIYTSIKDDNVGNPLDTNGDGNATEPDGGDWGAIQYRGTSDDVYSMVRQVQIWFAEHGLLYSNASAPISRSLIINSDQWGIGFDGDASPSVDSVTIQNSGRDPFIMSLNANPLFNDVEFLSNGSRGIALREGTSVSGTYFPSSRTLVSDASLAQRDVAGIENIAYIISTTLNVGTGVTLTIDPGVVLKFENARINVDGALIAEGTETERIIFTSIEDDSDGGDTNNDGNSSEPRPGDRVRIDFQSSDIDSLNLIRYADIRYTGGYYYRNYAGALMFHSSFGRVDNNIIQQSSEHAISIFGSADPEITNNEIYNISSTPIAMSMFANPVFSNNNALNIGSMAIGIVPETWSNTATVPQRDFAGYQNITYRLLGQMTINSGTAITIPAGTVFKEGSFEVQGAIKVEGTDADRVIFTHHDDDMYGTPKDTRGDGTSSSPGISSGDWIQFRSTSNDTGNVVDHAVFRYRHYGLVMSSAAPTVTNTHFEDIRFGLSLEGVSTPVVENNTFHNLTDAPMLLSLVSYPSSTMGNVISGTTFKGLQVRSETLVQDLTLQKRTFAGIARIPYIFQDYTIGTGAVLTIDPGVVLKFRNGVMTVNKGLIAEGGGTSDSLIVFTDLRDDFYGGDTNSDSTETSPSIGSWNGIRYTGDALDPQSILDYVVIKYAGRSYYDYAAVSAENASPTITNSVLTENYSGVTAIGSSNPVINNSAIFDNTGFGVYNRDQTFLIDATNNWWGSKSGPTHSTNPDGTGDAVSDMVDFDPWISTGAINPIMGDPSLNGLVQAYDASVTLQHVVGSITLNDTQLQVADVSGNGSVMAMDASYILQYVVGLIETFPATNKAKTDGTKGPIVYNVSDIRLDVSGERDAAGEYITYALKLDEVKDLLAVELDFTYNSEWVSLEQIEKGDLLNDQLLMWNDDKEGGLSLSMASTNPIGTSGTLAQLKFRILPDSDPEAMKLDVRRFVANEKDLSRFVTTTEANLTDLPESFTLYQNYPNPFNPTTTIKFDLAEKSSGVRIVVYDMLGRVIRTLVDKPMNAGTHEITWDGRSATGARVATGMYLYRIEAGSHVATKKMMLIK